MSLIRPLLVPVQIVLLTFCLASAAVAGALVDARLTVALIQYNGQSEVASAATGAKPGDVLEYTARYTNRGNAAADALSPSMPIPTGTEYLPTETVPKPSHASLDGTTFAPIPLRRPVQGADGVVRIVDVPVREYRALRWTVGTLAAGSEATVRARVRVAQLTSLASQ